jgi:integrase
MRIRSLGHFKPIDALPPAFGLPLTIGFLCGCRRAEALALTRHDLSPKGYHFPGSSPRLGWIALQRKKQRVGMVKVRIPIALRLVEQLRALLMSPFQEHVFGDPPPSPDVWSSLLTRQLRRLGLDYGVDTRGLCMHGTRHTATTTMQDLPGVSTQTAKLMGGWTTTRMVESYSSPAEASLQVAAMGLAKNFRPRKPKGLAKAAAARKRA